MSGWWNYLEDRTRQEVDENVLCDRPIMAIKVVWEALRPLEVSLREAEQVVQARYEVFGDRVRRAQPDPLDVPSLASRAGAHPGRVAAIEALWDGDTLHDWFVLLVAILDDPAGEQHLATVYGRTGGPPPGSTADRAGRALAQHLGVPFHFPSPDVPDDEAPRWRTVQRLPETP
ncbi:hypothetical protein ACWCXK_32760 [Streptomyces sp. NPDC001739]|uniref:hypothetical protein n=1 Tax=Streptomyces sp. NPDC001657 TaxID=3154522 RepID=UPI00331D00DA